MAVREEELQVRTQGKVLRFPAERAAARLRRQRLIEGRRRLAILIAGLAVIVGVILGGSGGTAVASKPGAPTSVVLQPGDTLWSIASEYAPDGIDPRAYVHALEQINDLEGAARAGAQLTLPR